MTDKSEINQLIDSGKIQVLMSGGKWWNIRRNGKTKTWKRNPNRFLIPYKAGIHIYGHITEADFDKEENMSNFYQIIS